MENHEVAELLERIASLLEIKGESVYKVVAYRRAADSIRHLGEPLERLRDDLTSVEGVGKALAGKLAELLSTGRLGYLDELEREIPAGVVGLLEIPDVGPKKARRLWQELGVTSVEEAERAAEAGAIRELKGMGARSEARILEGVRSLRRRTGRPLLATVLPAAERLLAGLRREPSVLRAELAGSLRRMRSTVGDLDVLVATRAPEVAIGAFVGLGPVASVELRGPTKCSVRLHDGLQVDLRVLEPERWGSALQYFTGSKQHNVELRQLALSRGMSLSEYGLDFAEGELVCGEEAEVYSALGLPWIPPELREGRGELAAAAAGELPSLVRLEDLRGDLHLHTDWSDGASSIEEMAEAGRALGLDYLVVTDHGAGFGFSMGLGPERLRAQRREIDRLNALGTLPRLLHGVEVDIRADGSLGLPEEVLAELDLVVASLHSGLRQDRARVTERVVQAMRNPRVHVIGHPTGRIIEQREGADLDMDRVLAVAAETGTALEVNASPDRLDLDEEQVRRAVRLGVRIAIGSDAHGAAGLQAIPFGVAVARRGWAEARHVVNTLTAEELLRTFAA